MLDILKDNFTVHTITLAEDTYKVYIDECSFRFTQGHCDIPTMDSIKSLCKAVKGKRLTYRKLLC